ncbi:Transcriptional regulator WAR1 [Cytospora mali]|uniref:Transcriptional regulator WAR1 n=1 Tax=Cytospora mali TaxID=578113 RepID=A0A194W2P9_CYTMA|nr:Transcriptional regulator WAR1 [Valsa mali]
MDRSSTEPISASARSNKGQQGKWGSACAVCSAAKAKCLRSDDTQGAPCDRCKRLAKECTSQVHFPRKKRSSRTSRTTQLEERLNGLVDLLRASGEIPTQGTRRSQSSGLGPSDREHEESSYEHSPRTPSAIGSTIHVPRNWNRHAPPRCICRAEVGEVPLQRRPDGELLEIYQSRLMPVFPFVPIPPGTQPGRLKAERPFLFSAICMAASIPDVRSMRGQMFSMVQRLTNEMFIESNRSMDLLQGIIVILAWYQNHCMMHTQLNNLVHIAQALLADLGLNKSPEVQERSSVMVLNPPQPHRRTNEERRAILGVWFLSSSVATGLQKVFPMKFSKYIKQCLEILEASPDYELDALLVHLVKIQHLSQQIYSWNSKEDEDEGIPGFPRAPASAYQAAFYGDINRLQASLPVSLRDDSKSQLWYATPVYRPDSNECSMSELLRVYFAFVTLHLNEPPPIDAVFLKTLAESLTDVNPSTPSALDIFYRAQSALQGFFESLFDIPTSNYPATPIFVMIQIVYSITMLARWAKILGPGHARRGNAPPDILTSQKVVWDPSAKRSAPNTIFGSGLAPLPSFTATNSRRGTEAVASTNTTSFHTRPSEAPAHHTKIPPSITDPSQIPASQFRESSDPSIPSVVASLKAKLLTQPGLNLDIIGILAVLAERCDQVHKELTEEGGGGEWHNDVWYLCAKKILIARAKLEKWAEIIASGGVSAGGPVGPAAQHAEQSDRDKDAQVGGADVTTAVSQASKSQQPSCQDEDTLAAFQRQIETAGQDVSLPDALADMWQYENVWTDNMLDQLDPSLWLNDGSDWSMALLGPTQESQFGM